MKEPLRITLLRHAVLLLFVAISLYPVLNVVSISLRPGDRLRSTDLAIIPADWTFASYRALFTEQPFLTWLGNSLVVSTVVTLTGVALAPDQYDFSASTSPSTAIDGTGSLFLSGANAGLEARW